MKKKVMFITTEIATDMYLSRLIKELKKNNLAISAVGLANIKKANPDFFLQSPKISCIGIYEAKKVAYKFFKFYKELKEWIKKITPDILVLADSPELNLRIAKYAKTKLNLKKILYFIPPTVWAWRAKRKYTIKKYVDKVIVVYPFELDIYKDLGVDTELIPHPLFDMITPKKISPRFDSNYIGLFPGSRYDEVKRHLDLMLEACFRLREDKVYIFKAQGLKEDVFLRIINNYKSKGMEIKLIEKDYDRFNELKAALACCGTVTLELAIAEIPQVVIYKLQILSYLLAKLLIKTKYISLPNILTGDKIIQELIQNFTAKELSQALLSTINSKDKIIKDYQRMKASLPQGGAINKLKDIIISML